MAWEILSYYKGGELKHWTLIFTLKKKKKVKLSRPEYLTCFWRKLFSCTGSPGEVYGSQQKPKIARLLSEQESLQSDSALLWYGQTFPNVDCQSDTLPVCVEWRLDQRAGCRKFCQYKAPLIDNCSPELGLHGQPFGWRLWDSKSIQVRPKKNLSTLILGKYRPLFKYKHTHIRTHTHTPHRGAIKKLSTTLKINVTLRDR